MYNAYGSNPSAINSIFYGNFGGQIFNASGTPVVTYSIVEGGYIGTGNLDADPLLGSLQNNGGFTQTMALNTGSPAIDVGDDANCTPTDQREVTRPQGSHCDMGAYEYIRVIPTLTPTDTATATQTPTYTATATPTPTQTPKQGKPPTKTPVPTKTPRR
jgi:hypothetical protein